MSDSSDEEAPSAISFKKAQTEHENEVNQITDFLKTRRAIKKEQSKRKNDFLRTQKIQKRLKEDDQQTPGTLVKKSKTIDRKLPQNIVDSLEQQKPNEANIDDVDQSKQQEEEEFSIDDSKNNEGDVKNLAKKEPSDRKVYKSLNIRVQALPKLQNKRIDTALDFKNKRLSKAHRESVSNVKVHHEKLVASGQKIISSSIPIVSMMNK